VSHDLFSHNLPESAIMPDRWLKPGKSASPLPLKRRGVRRTLSVTFGKRVRDNGHRALWLLFARSPYFPN
jgi:hypothetical protein